MTTNLALLLVAFQLKHWLCDYVLQNEYHLGKFKKKGWVAPLADHCWCHAFATYIIVALAYTSPLGSSAFHGMWVCAGLGALDFVLHFVMDRVDVLIASSETKTAALSAGARHSIAYASLEDLILIDKVYIRILPPGELVADWTKTWVRGASLVRGLRDEDDLAYEKRVDHFNRGQDLTTFYVLADTAANSTSMRQGLEERGHIDTIWACNAKAQNRINSYWSKEHGTRPAAP